MKTTGDGVLARFDGAGRAVRCAQAIVAEGSHLGLAVRAGVHAGECEVRGDDLAGMTVHVGARVTALAAAGEVLVTGTVRDLVIGSDLAFAERGRRAAACRRGMRTRGVVSGAAIHRRQGWRRSPVFLDEAEITRGATTVAPPRGTDTVISTSYSNAGSFARHDGSFCSMVVTMSEASTQSESVGARSRPVRSRGRIRSSTSRRVCRSSAFTRSS